MQPDEYIKKSLAGVLKGDKNTRNSDSEAIFPQKEGRMQPERRKNPYKAIRNDYRIRHL